MSDQEATAAAIGGVVASAKFEQMVHEAYEEMEKGQVSREQAKEIWRAQAQANEHARQVAEWLEYRGLPASTSLKELIEAERETAALKAGFDLVREENEASMRMSESIDEVAEQLDDARALLDAVRELHSPKPGWEREWKDPVEALAKGWPLCAGCQVLSSTAELRRCRTLAVLGVTFEAE